LWKNSTGTVIVVDDDASVRRALRSQLQSLGFTALLFQSAEELLTGDFPAGNVCLLVDVYMPGMSGIELCRRLAASGTRLPVILMSGRDDAQTRRIMGEVESSARLFKPFDEKHLLRAIRKASRGAPRAER
jgi:FixJ family two-component response regulator